VISTADVVPSEPDQPAPPEFGSLGEAQARALRQLLDDHRCEDALVLDITGVSDVADYFVIATVRSSTHLLGVYGYLMEYLKKQRLEPLTGPKRVRDNPWLLIDLGPVVVHLMERDTRAFYELEKLWFSGRILH
jgi:ribosome-associated protein